MLHVPHNKRPLRSIIGYISFSTAYYSQLPNQRCVNPLLYKRVERKYTREENSIASNRMIYEQCIVYKLYKSF